MPQYKLVILVGTDVTANHSEKACVAVVSREESLEAKENPEVSCRPCLMSTGLCFAQVIASCDINLGKCRWFSRQGEGATDVMVEAA
jgi:hypothetical protein